MNFNPLEKLGSFRPAGKYLLFGAAVFALGLLTHFPYEKIQHLLTKSIEKQSGFQIQVAELSPAFPFSIIARDINIQGPPGRGKPLDLSFEKIKITPSIFSIITGPLKLSFSAGILAEYEGSEWDVDFSYSPTDVEVTVETKGFKVRQDVPMDSISPDFAGAAPMTISSFVDLKIRLEGQSKLISVGDLTNAEGNVEITVKKVTIDNIPMISLIRFDRIKLKGELADGKLDIQSVALTGPDISGTANGSLKLAPYLMRSQLNLDCKLHLSESLAGIASMAGGSSGIRVENGETALRLIGSLDRLSVRGF